MYVKLERSSQSLYFSPKVLWIVNRCFCIVQHPSCMGSLLIWRRNQVVMGTFNNNGNIYNDFGSQKGDFFKSSCGNKSVLSWTLLLAQFFGKSIFSSSGACISSWHLRWSILKFLYQASIKKCLLDLRHLHANVLNWSLNFCFILSTLV